MDRKKDNEDAVDQSQICIEVLQYHMASTIEELSQEADFLALPAVDKLGLIEQVINNHQGHFTLRVNLGGADASSHQSKELRMTITVEARAYDARDGWEPNNA